MSRAIHLFLRRLVTTCLAVILKGQASMMGIQMASACRNLSHVGLILLGVAFMGHSANANGNMFDAFTYTGTQSSFTSGSVYVLSNNGNTLNVCMFTPSGTAPSLSYDPDCVLGQGTYNSNGYASIAFLGSTNNPNQLFAVGDNAGQIFLMTIVYSVSGVPTGVQTVATYQFLDPDNEDTGLPCGSVSSLAVDPNGNYLYIGCTGNTKINTSGDSTTVSAYDAVMTISKSQVHMPKVSLGIARINPPASSSTTTTLGDISVVAPSSSFYSYQNLTNYQVVSKTTGGAWGYAYGASTDAACCVNPKLRVYPPSYPAFSGTPYSRTGAVFFSGIISGSSSNQYPMNSGLICSNGTCTVAYNIQLSGSKSYSVITAAEYGVDLNGNPALYWNQVQAKTCTDGNVEAACFASSTSHSAVSCSLDSTVDSNMYINTANCRSANTFNEPANIPTTTWLDQILYVPTPVGAANDTSFTDGLLVMSTWNNSYLTYYSLAGNNFTPSVFMSSNGYNGEVGATVYGVNADANGNLLIQAGLSGLLGFNPFPTSTADNVATQTSVTYIPIPQDSNASSNNVGGEVIQGLKIAYAVVEKVAPYVVEAAPDPEQTRKCCQMTSNIPDGTLARTLGEKAYLGSFTYSKQQLKLMGIKPGNMITGIQLRTASGIGAQPSKDLRIKYLQIRMHSDGSTNSNSAESSSGSIVFNRSLCIERGSYKNTARNGYGPAIVFDRPHRYAGGDLTFTVRHSGSKNSERFYLRAVGDGGNGGKAGFLVGGAYAQLPSVWSWPTKIIKIKVAPQMKLMTRAPVQGEAIAPSECN